LKKFIILLNIALLSCFVSGCKNLGNEIPQFDSKIESDVKINCKNENYECKIFYVPEGISSISFEKPSNLKGFTISRNDDKFVLSKDGLEVNYAKDPLPNNTFLRFFMDILENIFKEKEKLVLKNEEEGERVYEGICNEKKYEVVLSKKGQILRISCKNPELDVGFKL